MFRAAQIDVSLSMIVLNSKWSTINLILIFKTGLHAPGFLKLFWFACVCVCAPRVLIINGMIWCDINQARLVKQVLQLSLLSVAIYDTCHR